ncbi:competence protein CoiA family protein [Photobacterium profundum]|uniref:Competence protein CoiA-like N-terminal domain-containing protein n=1 Tax=Photobacterium profundum (strain SS9) TaxID=298386 RepID=Q6LRG1_PHOPR|nr:competence protein CoiA family protein [Photobacterium profundum]CAG20115.1 conserved hypothetical protein [Photobacterium profundum SS9]
MSLTLIPFGLETSTNNLVDVAEVENGKKCGCICPSCSTPLIAKQGNEKAWHFSHSSKGVKDKTKDECAYNFYLSLRLMARQVISGNLTIALPEYKKTLAKKTSSGKYAEVPYLITPPSEITLLDVKVESIFHGHHVDIVGNISGYDFCIYFTHPDRTVPYELEWIRDSKSGIIEIKLDALHKVFLDNRKKDGLEPFKNLFLEFLRTDLKSKRWISHPRFQRAKESAEKQLNAMALRMVFEHKKSESKTEEKKIPSAKKELPHHRCAKCSTAWSVKQGYICPKCFTVCRTSH